MGRVLSMVPSKTNYTSSIVRSERFMLDDQHFGDKVYEFLMFVAPIYKNHQGLSRVADERRGSEIRPVRPSRSDHQQERRQRPRR
jgi:hypothetical protein